MSVSNTLHILDTHKDNQLTLQQKLSEKRMKLQSFDFSNQRYMSIKLQVDDLRYEIQICEDDLFNHIGALNATEEKYQDLKESLKIDLEHKLTETINVWYNENVNLKFEYSGTSTKDKRKAVKLIDKNKGVRLKEVTGDAACQTVGLLVAICIAKMRGLSFLLFDEPFSNFNDISSEKVPDLLKNIIGDMQIVIIENKETVLKNLHAYTYILDKEGYPLIDQDGRQVLDNKMQPVFIYKSIISSVSREDMFIPLIEKGEEEP